jgi:hypothetical protein
MRTARRRKRTQPLARSAIFARLVPSTSTAATQPVGFSRMNLGVGRGICGSSPGSRRTPGNSLTEVTERNSTGIKQVAFLTSALWPATNRGT